MSDKAVKQLNRLTRLVRDYAPEGTCLVDPFCDTGDVLIAAARAGVTAIGVEGNPLRAVAARERLAFHALAERYPVLDGSVTSAAMRETLSIDENGARRRFSLCLTQIPTFGDPSLQDNVADQFEHAYYEHYVQALQTAFNGVYNLLDKDGWCVVVARNIKLGESFTPVVWDLARLLAQRFVVHDVQAPGDDGIADDHAIICRKQSFGLDIEAADMLLQKLAKAGFVFILYGSLARRFAGDERVVPNDIDLLCPHDDSAASRLLTWLDEQGFSLESWNATVVAPVSIDALAHRYYFRARRIDQRGSMTQIDIAFATDKSAFDTLQAKALHHGGYSILTT